VGKLIILNFGFLRNSAKRKLEVGSHKCLAAFSALNVARKLAFKRAYTPQRRIVQTSESFQSILTLTVTQFWELISDFSAVCPNPPWIDQLNTQHPFLLKSNGGDILPNHNQSTEMPLGSQ